MQGQKYSPLAIGLLSIQTFIRSSTHCISERPADAKNTFNFKFIRILIRENLLNCGQEKKTVLKGKVLTLHLINKQTLPLLQICVLHSLILIAIINFFYVKPHQKCYKRRGGIWKVFKCSRQNLQPSCTQRTFDEENETHKACWLFNLSRNLWSGVQKYLLANF